MDPDRPAVQAAPSHEQLVLAARIHDAKR